MDRGENNKYLKPPSFVCVGPSISYTPRNEQQKPLNIGLLPQKERIIFQSSILRGLLLVSGRANKQTNKQTRWGQKHQNHQTFDKVRIIIILLAVSYQTYQYLTSGFSNPPSQKKHPSQAVGEQWTMGLFLYFSFRGNMWPSSSIGSNPQGLIHF